MTDSLHIGVIDFKRTVVGTDVQRVLREEERVVVNPLFLAINVTEGCHLGSVRGSENVGSLNVEVLAVKLVRLLEVADKTGGMG